MSDFLKYVAAVCTDVINDPEKNINKIRELLNQTENKGVVFLSLVKVFKTITPLYKIRTGTEKVGHRNSKTSISKFDTDLLSQYNAFVKAICASQNVEAFQSASILLKTLDHFNFVDRLIGKVLIGTTKEKCKNFSIESILDRIKNDKTGETIFLIINTCLDYKFGNLIVKALNDCPYLEECVQKRIDKEEKYLKKEVKSDKKSQLSKEEKKKEKEFFKKRDLKGIQKKEDKKRIRLQKETKIDELEQIGLLDDKNYVRTVNAIQRLYFTILKDKRKDCLFETFFGVRKYHRIIRKEFYEGLYTLLNENLILNDDNYTVKSNLQCMKTILHIYSDNGVDMKKVISIIFDLIKPMNFAVENEDFLEIKEVIEDIFLKNTQPSKRVCALMQRMMHARCMRYIECYKPLIKALEVKYNIDYSERDIRNKNMYDPEVSDIDKVPEKPFYEFQLYNRFL